MIKVLLFIVSLALLAGAVVALDKAQEHRRLTDADSARAAEMPIPVTVYEVRRGELVQSMPSECRLVANATVELGTDVADGVILKSMVDVGDQVKAGQKVAQFDDRVQLAGLEEAQKRVDWLQREVVARRSLVDYYENNREKGFSLEAEYLQADVNWLNARGRLETALKELISKKLTLQKMTVTAPSDGVVVSVAPVGQVIRQSSPVATLAYIDPIRMECDLPDEWLIYVKPGKSIKANFYGQPGNDYIGQVISVGPEADPDRRTVKVTAELKNQDHALLPGLIGIGKIEETRDSLRLPSIALVNPSFEFKQVFVVNGQNIAELREIKTGVVASGYVEVLGGVKPGDQVVIVGQLGLHDGDEVAVRDQQ